MRVSLFKKVSLALCGGFVVSSFAVVPSLSKVNDCYQIGSTEDLVAFASIVNNGETGACGELTKNIVFNENVLNEDGSLNGTPASSWTTPIGSSLKPFSGVFHGHGYKISGLYVNDNTAKYVTLFRSVKGSEESPVVIDSLGVEDSYISEADGAAAFVAESNGYLRIIGCHSSSTIKTVAEKGDFYYNGGMAGGIVSTANPGGNVYIDASYNSGNVSSTEFAGGLVGYAYGTVSVYNSFNSGSVSASASDGYAGGISGCRGAVVNSFNVGKVSAKSAQAFVGYSSATIKHCFYGGETATTRSGAQQKDMTYFYDGSVALELNKYSEDGVDGSVWGQDASVANSLPDLGGKLYFPLTFVTYDADVASYLTKYEYGVETALPAAANKTGFTFWSWNTQNDFKGDGVLSISAEESGAKTFYAEYVEDPALVGDCYQIGSAAQLYAFADIVNGTNGKTRNAKACGELTKNIVVNEDVLKNDGSLNGKASNFHKWTPIGTESTPYSGSFNGKGHTISGLYIDDDANKYVGLFGYVQSAIVSGSILTVEIDSLGIVDSYIKGGLYVGALVGFAGDNYHTALNIGHCYNTSTVIGSRSVGGIVGEISEAADGTGSYAYISACYNSGRVVGVDDAESVVGGLLGYAKVDKATNGNKIRVYNSYNIGSIESNNYAGGLVGYGNNPAIVNSYGAGTGPQNLTAMGEAVVENSFRLGGLSANHGTLMTKEEFNNGTVAALLHSYSSKEYKEADETNVTGDIWGQNVSISNSYPDFSGDMSKIKFDITFELYAGDPEVVSYTYGEIPTHDDPADILTECNVREYLYWTVYENGNWVRVNDFKAVTGSLTYKAKYDAQEARKYEYTYLDEDGVTPISSNNVQIYDCSEKGAGVRVLNPKKDEDDYYTYTFKEWVLVSEDALGNATYKASYTAVPRVYAINFYPMGGSFAAGSEVKNYTYGVGVEQLPSPTQEKYDFDGWYVDKLYSGEKVTAISTTDYGIKTFYAKWSATTYSVTLNTVGGTIAEGEDVNAYTYGVGAELPTPTLENYDFDGWYLDAKYNSAKYTEISSVDFGDMKFYAKWTAKAVVTESSSSEAVEESSSSEVVTESSSSEAVEESSSSEVVTESSSSEAVEESSSSEVVTESSSSEVVEESSSSEAAAESSSSSSSKGDSSSSSDKDAIEIAGVVPQFHLVVVNHSIQVSGAKVGSKFALMDMQGRVISVGRVQNANFNVEVPRAGSFIVRVNNQMRRVNVK